MWNIGSKKGRIKTMIGYCNDVEIVSSDGGVIILFYQTSVSGDKDLFSSIYLSDDNFKKFIQQRLI
ncbi:MAG: hypothetical protein ACYDG2_24955 [Ruminiclostridium sp.]